MLKARTRDIVATLILTIAIVSGAILGWRYATANVVDLQAPRPVASSAKVDEFGETGVLVAGRSIGTDWTVDALGHLGIPIATAEKATVALYGAIVGGVLGLIGSAVFSEPIAATLTAWPRHRKRVLVRRKGRQRHADGLRD